MHPEKRIQVISGWTMLPVTLAALFGGVALFIYFFVAQANAQGAEVSTVPLFASILLFIAGILLWAGHFTQQPNEARVLILFGEYIGTVRDAGFHWANPFYTKRPVSLRL